MSESYYELIDESDSSGGKFAATDLVRSRWSSANLHGVTFAGLLVLAVKRCEHRDDTRLSRVMVDLLGGVPAEGDLWVRSRIERSGKQIELVSAEMLAPGSDREPRPVAKASGWRLKTINTPDILHAPPPPLRPLSDTHSRGLADRWDRNYVHSVDWRWLNHRGDSG